MMLKNTVWPAMAEAYRSAKGELVDRFLAALDAAEAEGGDIRGRQSAAILIVEAKNTGRPWIDTIFDLRVDDAPEPLIEIRRLVAVRRAYIHMRLGNEAAQRSDLETTEREFTAAERLIGDNPEMRYWHAIALLQLGKIDDGLAILREVARARSQLDRADAAAARLDAQRRCVIERPRAESAGMTVAFETKAFCPADSQELV